MAIKISLIGNCQVRTYAMLLKMADSSVEIDLMDYAEPSSRIEENRRDFFERIKDSDYVLCQENGLSYTNFVDITREYGTGKLIKICNFFFRGIFPDMCYLGKFDKRMGLTDYNSAIVVGSFLQGLSVEECRRNFNQEKLTSLGLHKAWEDSLAEMKHRDRELDFPGAPLTEKLVRATPCFRTFNHPNDVFLAEYLESILLKIGVALKIPRILPTLDPLHFIEFPVYDFVAESLDLDYRTPQYLRRYKDFVDLDTFIAKNYELYSQIDVADIVINSPADLLKEIDDHDPNWLSPRPTASAQSPSEAS